MDDEDRLLVEEIRNDGDSGVDDSGVDDSGVDDSGADDAEGASRGSHARHGRAVKRGGLAPWMKIGGIFLGLGSAAALVLWSTGVFVYSKTVDEVLSEPQSFVGREIRVEGQLRLHSAEFQPEPCEHRFVLTPPPPEEGQPARPTASADMEMPVRYSACVVPDTFNDSMPMNIVVQGQLQADGTFVANEVIPRCPSKYEMRERMQDGESAPHEMPAT